MPIDAPPAPPLPDQQGQRKTKSHRLLLLTFLIPPLLGICLCAVSLVVYGSASLIPSTFADKLWSDRITQKLQEKGLSTQNISITRDPTDNLFSQMDIRVGIKESKDYQEYQDVVVSVHKSIFEALDTPVFPPEGVGKINVFINDDMVGYYRISIDYEIAHQYQQGKIKRDDYIQHWRFNPE
jgi:hypothetical protein